MLVNQGVALVAIKSLVVHNTTTSALELAGWIVSNRTLFFVKCSFTSSKLKRTPCAQTVPDVLSSVSSSKQNGQVKKE